MAEPKKKTSKSRKNIRRVRFKNIKPAESKKCKSCGKLVSMHVICSFCNTYNK